MEDPAQGRQAVTRKEMTKSAWRFKFPADLPALAAAFLLVVGFTFSDDVVEFLLDLSGNSALAASDRQWLVLAADLALVLLTAALKWRISGNWRLNRWWVLGALLVIASHLALILTAERRAGLGDLASIGINLAGSAVFVSAMIMLMVATLSDGPASRSWIIPLAVGTFAVQIASALWYPVINVDDGCAGEVSSAFFADMNNINAVLLLTMTIELNQLRRNSRDGDPGTRVAPVFTVLLICTALALAFSVLVKADSAPCGLAAVWHEYIAFVVNVQALAIGLATLVWLYLVNAGEVTSEEA